MNTKIIGDTLPAVICKLQKGETVLTRIGWKRDNSYYMGDE